MTCSAASCFWRSRRNSDRMRNPMIEGYPARSPDDDRLPEGGIRNIGDVSRHVKPAFIARNSPAESYPEKLTTRGDRRGFVRGLVADIDALGRRGAQPLC